MTPRGMTGLPLRAAYSVGELARAARIDRRRLHRILKNAGVSFLMSGNFHLVSISELERKVPALWEGIKTAYTLGGDER